MNTAKIFTFEEVIATLEQGDFQKFIGIQENEFFEAKRKLPYDINNEEDLIKRAAIMELSEDITMLANNHSAVIVCGLITDKVVTQPDTDYVKDLDLINEQEFLSNYAKLPSCVASFPKIEAEIKWYPSSSDNTKGLGAIVVPEQKEEKKPFFTLINETDGQHIKKGYFGIPYRVQSEKKWKTAQEVHKIAKDKPRDLVDVQNAVISKLDDILDSINHRPVYPSKNRLQLLEKLMEKTKEEDYGN